MPPIRAWHNDTTILNWYRLCVKCPDDRRERNKLIVEPDCNSLLKTAYTLEEIEAIAPGWCQWSVGPTFAEFLVTKRGT